MTRIDESISLALTAYLNNFATILKNFCDYYRHVGFSLTSYVIVLIFVAVLPLQTPEKDVHEIAMPKDGQALLLYFNSCNGCIRSNCLAGLCTKNHRHIQPQIQTQTNNRHRQTTDIDNRHRHRHRHRQT